MVRWRKAAKLALRCGQRFGVLLVLAGCPASPEQPVSSPVAIVESQLQSIATPNRSPVSVSASVSGRPLALAPSPVLTTSPASFSKPALISTPAAAPTTAPTPALTSAPTLNPSTYDAQILDDGRRLVFPPLAAQLLESDAAARLEVEFENGGKFPLDQYRLGLNGVGAVAPAFFDISTVSAWMLSNGRTVLGVSTEKLRFDNGLTFIRKASMVIGDRGNVVIWLSAPLAVTAARLVFGAAPTIDLPAPDPIVLLDLAPPKVGDQTSVAFQFHSGTGLTQFQCALDGARFSVCSSPISYGSLGYGHHRFEVRVAGEMEEGGLLPITVYDFKIVQSVPGVIIQSENPSASPTTDTSMMISFTVPSNEHDHKHKHEHEVQMRHAFCQLDSGTFKKCFSPVSYSGLLDGLHTVVIQRGKQPSPRFSAASYHWIVDTVPPVAQWLSTPPSLTNSSSASFAFQANKPSQFSCALDSESSVACDSPYTLSSLGAGTHTLSITATDSAGTVSQPISFSWTIDLTPPVITLEGANPPQSPMRSTSLSLSFTASEPSTFTCGIDGAAPAACTSPVLFAGLADGNHSATIVATDLADNIGNPVVYSWIVDTTAPVLSLQMISPTTVPTNSSSAQFTLDSSEPSTFTCTLNGGAPFVCTSPLQLTDLSPGTQTLSVTGTDAAGNVSLPNSISWLIDQTPPVLTITSVIPSESVTSATSIQIAFASSKPATTYCELDQSGLAPCTAPFIAN